MTSNEADDEVSELFCVEQFEFCQGPIAKSFVTPSLTGSKFTINPLSTLKCRKRALESGFFRFQIFQDALEEPELSPKNDTLDVISNNNGGISPRSLSKKFRFKKKKRVRSGEDEVPPLSETLEDAKLSVDMFLNNQFDEARAICQPM